MILPLQFGQYIVRLDKKSPVGLLNNVTAVMQALALEEPDIAQYTGEEEEFNIFEGDPELEDLNKMATVTYPVLRVDADPELEQLVLETFVERLGKPELSQRYHSKGHEVTLFTDATDTVQEKIKNALNAKMNTVKEWAHKNIRDYSRNSENPFIFVFKPFAERSE